MKEVVRLPLGPALRRIVSRPEVRREVEAWRTLTLLRWWIDKLGDQCAVCDEGPLGETHVRLVEAARRVLDEAPTREDDALIVEAWALVRALELHLKAETSRRRVREL